MDELPDFLKNIMGIFKIIQPESGTWVNVAKLNSEDMMKKKNHDSQVRRLMSEGKVLYTKLHVVQGQLEANKAEFWDGIYKAYNLPSDHSYRIDETGQVLKHVPVPPAENVEPTPESEAGR